MPRSRHPRTAVWLALLAVLSLGLAACGEELAEQAEEFELGSETEAGTAAGQPSSPEEADLDATSVAWATSDVGSAGYAALVSLSRVLNREWAGFSVDVLPTAGAVQSVIGYATGEFDGYYGADIAFYEMAQGTGRFEGFADQAERMPVQSFWAYPLETGVAIHARDAEEFQAWADLAGQPVFTGPAPWDVRANLERAMGVLDVGHEYVEVDTGVAGSTLDSGDIAALIAYTTAGEQTPPWLQEAELQTDLQILNPSPDEISRLEEAGLEVVEVGTDAFQTDVGVDTAWFVPFFYGFHVGTEISEDDVYRMLSIIEDHVDELAEADPSYSVLAADMADFQRRGVESAVDDVEVHPGLARWMSDHNVWDDAWDDRIASP